MIERFGHLAQRMFNTPLMIHPRKAEIAVAAMLDQMGYGRPTFMNPQAFDDDGDVSFRRSGRTISADHGYDMVGPVAVIPVSGTLVQKLGSLRPYSGMTGYDGLRHAFMAAIDDPEAEAVVFDIDSPGGEVAGCFDLCDMIYECRGAKPIWSILNENAFSAAYAIGSCADPGRLIVPRTGGTGSIGVICMHVDFSQRLKDEGLKITFIQRGRKKADGHPEIPLSDEALEDLQTDIDTMGELFEDTVARNRGLSPKKVFDLEAGTFLGADGVSLGLADDVMAPDAAFQAVLAELA